MPERVQGPPVVETWLTSPCVGICHLDQATGWCGGCGRSEKELAGWGDMLAFAQRAVWADLPRRYAILGTGYRLLPWSGPLLLDRLASLSATEDARWSMGVCGATAGFGATVDPADIVIKDGALYLRTHGGRAMVKPTPGTRAFQLVDPSGAADRIVLALHRVRFKILHPDGLTYLGLDEAALDPQQSDFALVDLGFARRSMQFCVRLNPEAADRLMGEHGNTNVLHAPAVLEEVKSAAPDWVVMTPLGRIEVAGLPRQNDASRPSTKLDAKTLSTGRELPVGLNLPPDYVACAQLIVGEGLLPH